MSGPNPIWGGTLHPLGLNRCTEIISVPEIIPGLASGEVAVISAPGGVGKSFLLLEMALGFASGKRTVLPVDGVPQRVLYLGFQDDLIRLHNRMVMIFRAFPEAYKNMGENLNIFFYKGRRPALVVQGEPQTQFVKDLKNLCEGHSVVILDPLSKLHACNENDNYQMDVLTDVLCAVAEETKTTLIVAHHSGKVETTDETGKKKKMTMRGASAIEDGIRLGLRLVPEDKQNGADRVSLRWAKCNGGEIPPPIMYRRYGGVLVPPWWGRAPYAGEEAGWKGNLVGKGLENEDIPS